MTDPITIRVMTEADIPFGMTLKAQAGWNQTQADWARFLAMQPRGCFVAEWAGRPVGTVVTCAFGPVGWVAMMLVDVNARRRGIGSALMRQAIDYLDSRHVTTICLDATPDGAPMYERFDFAPVYGLTRYRGRPIDVGRTATAIIPYQATHLDAITDLDQAVTATDRRKLLTRLLAEHGAATRVICRDGRLVGYVATRPGSTARHVGPCIASDREPGETLLGGALDATVDGEVIIDVPDANPGAVRLVKSRGLIAERPLLRMVRGRPVADRSEHIWATSGPELG